MMFLSLMTAIGWLVSSPQRVYPKPSSMCAILLFMANPSILYRVFYLRSSRVNALVATGATPVALAAVGVLLAVEAARSESLGVVVSLNRPYHRVNS